MNTLRREIKWYPAYDKTNTDQRKNYGIHGVDMRWYVIGDAGAVQWVVYTNWHLPHVQESLKSRGHRYEPQPADLGYHSKTPRYEGHEPMRNECELTGGTCYYGGSGLNAEPVFQLLLEKGGEAVWEYLENYYLEVFGEPA